MADASLNRRMTVRLGDAVAFAQIGIVGLDGQIELEALRLCGLPEAARTLLCGTPALRVSAREFQAEVGWDLRGDAGRRTLGGRDHCGLLARGIGPTWRSGGQPTAATSPITRTRTRRLSPGR